MLEMNSGSHKTNRNFPLPPGEGQGAGASIRQLAISFDPLSPTLPRRGRGNVGQQCISMICPGPCSFKLACFDRRMARCVLRCCCSSFFSTPRDCMNRLLSMVSCDT